MGLLNDAASSGLKTLGVDGFLSRKIERPAYVGNDFQALTITEYIDRKPQEDKQIILAGTFMPHNSLDYGGEQRIVSEYYSGSTQPTVNVLGPKEGPVSIKGHLKSKFFKKGEVDLRTAAQVFAILLDQMRIRGNIVRVNLGEWVRYGIIERSNFKMRTLADIEYDIEFFIIGFTFPEDNKLVQNSNNDLVGPNEQIQAAAETAILQGRAFPEEMPLTIADAINNAISDIATAINSQTAFINGIIDDAERINASLNRAVGLIKNTRATIARNLRRIGQITTDINTLGSRFTNEAQKTTAALKNARSINDTYRNFSNLASLLSLLQAKFQGLSQQIPYIRHPVREGDNLQKISIRYYNDALEWKRIYDHNKLQSTDLVRGTVLEIPKR